MHGRPAVRRFPGAPQRCRVFAARAPRAAAAATARAAITEIIAARYSAEPCRSLLRPAAGTLIPLTASAEKLEASAFSISATRNTVGPAPVTATRGPLGPLATKTPTSAKREAGWRSFWYAAFLTIGKLTDWIISPGSSAVSKRPLKKSPAAMLRRSVLMVASSATTAAG